jgi:hypothetical protein
MKFYANRMNHDVAELFNQTHRCTGSDMVVKYNETESIEAYNGNVELCIQIYEGPYRGGMSVKPSHACYCGVVLFPLIDVE